MSVEQGGVEHDDRVINRLSKLNLHIPETGIRRASLIMGKDLRIPASEAEKIRAERYIHSRFKSTFERAVAVTMLKTIGNRKIRENAELIAEIDPEGGSPFFLHNVGILHAEGRVMFPQIKIRTMIPDASKMVKPLETTGIIAGTDFALKKDDRVISHPSAMKLRESAGDEYTQLPDVVNGNFSLIGIRFFTEEELDGIEIMTDCRYNARVGMDNLLIGVLENYPKRVSEVNPKPAMLSMLSAMWNKDTRIGLRLWAGYEYLNRANFGIDIRIAIFSLNSRFIKKYGVR